MLMHKEVIVLRSNVTEVYVAKVCVVQACVRLRLLSVVRTSDISDLPMRYVVVTVLLTFSFVSVVLHNVLIHPAWART